MTTPVATGWSLLDGSLSSIPTNAGINPYAYVLADLKQHFATSGVTGDSHATVFLANMAVIIAIYCLCLIANVFTLVVKWKTGSVWLFRTRSTLHGSLITVNTTALYTVWSSVFVLSSTVYIGLLISALHRQVTPVPAQAIMALIWVPMCLSLFTEAHGMMVAIYLSKPEQRFFGRIVHANVLNAIALAFYIIEPLALIPYFALSAHATQRTYDSAHAFAAWLSSQAATWTEPAAFAMDATSRGILLSMDRAGDDVAKYLSNGFKVFFFCIVASALVFIPASIGYLGLLRRQMRGQNSFRHSLAVNSSSNEKRYVASNSSKQSDRLESLAISYRLMIIEVCLVLVCTLCYCCLNGWAGWFIESIMDNSSYVVLQHALFYWTFALFGTPVCFLVAYRSWSAYQVERYGNVHLQSGSSSGGNRFQRSIEVTTAMAVDNGPLDGPLSLSKAYVSDKPFLELDSVGPVYTGYSESDDEKA